MADQPNFYALIPSYVRYCKDLESAAKLLYGEITALCSREGYCWASNAYFSQLYDVDDRTIKRWLSSLKNKNFIKVEVDTKGNQTSRKIYISDAFQEFFKGGQNCHGGGTKMSPGGGKNVPHINTMSNTYNEDITSEVQTPTDAPPPEKIPKQKKAKTESSEDSKALSLILS
jgi:hypothetical protein